MSSGIIWKQGYRLPMREWHMLNADINLKQKILHHSFPFTIWIFVLAAALINLSLLPRTLDQNWTGEGSCLWKQLFSSTLSPKQLPFFETKTEPERGSKLKKKAPRHKIAAWKAQRQIADCFVGKCLSSPVFRKDAKKRQGWLNILE